MEADKKHIHTFHFLAKVITVYCSVPWTANHTIYVDAKDSGIRLVCII